jgi:hypothetical protein
MRTFSLITLLFCFTIFTPEALYGQFRIDVESGAIFQGYNRIQVPVDEGTRFDLDETFNTDGRFFYRIKLLYTFNDKHTFAALYAPLDVRSVGTPQTAINFAGTRFLPDNQLDVLYVFNSYRLTYRYLFPRTGNFQFGLGATAKIRDARIQLTSDGREAEKKNVGFVPLINFRIEWMLKERLSLLLQGDALVSTQGRAEDVLLAAQFYPNRNITLKAGYRILEGGADNDEVYNFSLIHYALIGGVFRF